jgi:hypothetical protein
MQASRPEPEPCDSRLLAYAMAWIASCTTFGYKQHHMVLHTLGFYPRNRVINGWP